LFDIDADTANEAHDENRELPAENYQALGIAAELAAASRLIHAGRSVAEPVSDDDGVDLIVDYTSPSPTLVQVKSSAQRNASGTLGVNLENARASERRNPSHGLKAHVDVLIVFARDTERWWV
jgi:hypothetical protein